MYDSFENATGGQGWCEIYVLFVGGNELTAWVALNRGQTISRKKFDRVLIVHEMYKMPIQKSVPRNYEDCAFYFWIHTAFMSASGHLTLERHELDNPHKSKTWKHFTDGFSCTIHAKILDN